MVDAFLAAAHRGDFDALMAVLDPDIVLRTDGGAAHPRAVVRGAAAVAGRALTFAHLHPFARPVVVNGVAGVLVAPHGRPFSIMAFTVVGQRIVAMDTLGDPDRLARLDCPPSMPDHGLFSDGRLAAALAELATYPVVRPPGPPSPSPAPSPTPSPSPFRRESEGWADGRIARLAGGEVVQVRPRGHSMAGKIASGTRLAARARSSTRILG